MQLLRPDLRDAVSKLLSIYGIKLCVVESTAPIPGSYWGEPEAGLIAATLFVRDDTPLHSALHEACHFICMDEARRTTLHTDAGGEHAEENAVCYLQVLLATQLPHITRDSIFRDMDDWGYTFRLGSTQAWFEHDAEDARAWLIANHIIDKNGVITGRRAWQMATNSC